MGCGKSSVGRELAGLLSLPFIDLDGYIEMREGRSVREIFAAQGEPAFRALELKALKEILLQGKSPEAADGREYDGSGHPGKEDCPRNGNLVLALGGGTLTTPECAELVARHTFCIHLKASPETLFARLENGAENRPMLDPRTGTGSGDTGGIRYGSHGNLRSSSHGDLHGSSSETGELRLRRRITELLSERKPVYEKTARLSVPTDGFTAEQTAAAVAGLLTRQRYEPECSACRPLF